MQVFFPTSGSFSFFLFLFWTNTSLKLRKDHFDIFPVDLLNDTVVVYDFDPQFSTLVNPRENGKIDI